MSSLIPPLKVVRLGCSFLAVTTFAASSDSPAPSTDSAVAPERSAEQKAMLQALDHQLAQFESRLSQDGNAPHAATVRAALEVFKQRRDTLNRLAFDQSKYDELRFDLNVAYQRLNLWLAPPIAPKGTATTKAAPSTQRD